MPINYHPIFEQFLDFVGRQNMTADEATERLTDLYGERYGNAFIVALLDNMGNEQKARRQMFDEDFRAKARRNSVTYELTREQMGLPEISETSRIMNEQIRKARSR